MNSRLALLVNPYDPDSVAAAIGQALAISLVERRERHDFAVPGALTQRYPTLGRPLSCRVGTEAERFKPARANAFGGLESGYA